MKDISKKIINFNQNKEKIIIDINEKKIMSIEDGYTICLLYTSPSPRDAHESRMPSSA